MLTKISRKSMALRLNKKILYINIIISRRKREIRLNPWSALSPIQSKWLTHRRLLGTILRLSINWTDPKSLRRIVGVTSSKSSNLSWRMTRWNNSLKTVPVWMLIKAIWDHSNSPSKTDKWRSSSFCRGRTSFSNFGKTFLARRRNPNRGILNAMLFGDFGQPIRNDM